MKEFLMNDKTVNLPTTWEEIDWKRFLAFSNIIESNTDGETKTKKKKVKAEDEWKEAIKALDINTKILSFWTELPEDEIGHWDMKEAEAIMDCLSFVNHKYEPIEISSFKLGDEEFFLPRKDMMATSSFNRYIEAEQLEIHSNLIREGRIEIMPRQVAILCKKEGDKERLNDDEIDRRAKLFEGLDMATIWDVAFFLNKLEQGLMTSFLTYQMVEMQKEGELQKEL